MKKSIMSVMVAATSCTLATTATAAEPEVSFDLSADVVSSYIWRGQNCGGFSIQPGATVSYKGLSFGVWSSAELFEGRTLANMSEFDLSLSYSLEGLSIGFTDYFFCDGKYGQWTWNQNSLHQFEVNFGYDFGPVALSWNTMLGGFDAKADGDRAYSTYFGVSAPFKLGGLDCSAEVGCSPWEDSIYGRYDGFNVVNCAITVNKDIKGLPLMGQIVYNPHAEATYFVVGISF